MRAPCICVVGPQNFGIDKGIAVAIAADPAAEPQERGDRHIIERRIVSAHLPFDLLIEPRHFVEECVIVIGEAVGDFVADIELRPAQQARLPQQQDSAADLVLDLLFLVGRPFLPVAPFEQMRDRHLAHHRALAPHLGRMRGQDRDHEGVIEEILQLGRGDPGLMGAGEGARQRARLRRGRWRWHRAASCGSGSDLPRDWRDARNSCRHERSVRIASASASAGWFRA